MPINEAMLETAAALREKKMEGEPFAARSLRMAFADFAEAIARTDTDEEDAMAAVAATVTLAIIGLSSGFANGDPNPNGARATILTIGELTSDCMNDFMRSFKASREARH